MSAKNSEKSPVQISNDTLESNRSLYWGDTISGLVATAFGGVIDYGDIRLVSATKIPELIILAAPGVILNATGVVYAFENFIDYRHTRADLKQFRAEHPIEA